jgi:hypothetical protein
MTEQKRKRGRPPGPPKPPKEPKPMGRPTVWDKRHGKAKCAGITAPERFFEFFKDQNFRKKISDLMLDFSAEK